MTASQPGAMIVIAGGVGPAAGVDLHRRVINHTLTNGSDQDHFEILHYSRSSDISDRTEFLLGTEDENPANGMLRILQVAEAVARKSGKRAVAGIPCHTFHAEPIFSELTRLLNTHRVQIELLHLLDETVVWLKTSLRTIRKIGVMTTSGSRKVDLYPTLLEPHEFEVIQVPESMQDLLHQAIYDRAFGIKATVPVSDRARQDMLQCVEALRDRGAEAVLLGCSEIPMALPETSIEGIPIINPIDILARALIRVADPTKVRERVEEKSQR